MEGAGNGWFVGWNHPRLDEVAEVGVEAEEDTVGSHLLRLAERPNNKRERFQQDRNLQQRHSLRQSHSLVVR